MKVTRRTCSPVTRRRLEMQGFLGHDDATLAEVGPWLRLVPGISAAWVAIGTTLASPVVIWCLLPFLLLGVLRRGHPFDFIYNHGLRHLLGTRPIPPYGAPRRFSSGVATVYVVAIGAAFHFGATMLGYLLGSGMVLAALFPTTNYFCIPAFFYGLLFGPSAAQPAQDRGHRAQRSEWG
jgi:hypothetical protein